MLEIATLIAAFSGVLLAGRIALGFGKGAMRIPFYFFSASIFILFLSLLFLFLSENQVFFHLNDVTMHIWVHILAVLGLVLFVFGGKKLNDIARDPIPNGVFSGTAKFFLTLTVLCAIGIFFVSAPLEARIAPIFINSSVDIFGLHHFSVFFLALLCVVYVWSVRDGWGKMLNIGIAPFFCFLFLIGIQHFWETTTESWKLFIISPDQIEFIERLLLLPAYIMLDISFFRMKTVVL